MGESWVFEQSREITRESCSVKVAQALPRVLSRIAEAGVVFRNFWRKIELFCCGDFVHDGLRGRARILGGEDWPAHYDEISCHAKCFGRGGGTGLIIVLGGKAFVLWADAGRDNQEIAPARFANRARLPHGTNDAINPSFLGKLREFQHAALWCAAEADLADRFLVHAGQDGDCE